MYLEIIKKPFRTSYYKLYNYYYLIKERIISPKNTDYKKIPIIINNRNRLSTLQKLINSLEIRGYKNIYIIDNNSDYPPLLNYYQQSKYKIYMLDKNVGYLSLWQTPIYKEFIHDFYVYTDSDVVPIEECPHNFLETFLNIMKEKKFAKKVGCSLKIDDLPDFFDKKQEVIEWESQYFTNKVDEILYKAPIDTTFALYRPWYKGPANKYLEVYRVGYPFEARHLPWYNNSSNLSEEELYYIKHASTSTHWTIK